MNNKVPFSRTYRDFFSRTLGERHVFLQGGRRSAKTFSTFLHLFILTSFIIQSGRASSLSVLVVCHEYPQLQNTMEDFKSAIGVPIIGNKTLGDHATTCGGRVVWQFKAFDSKEKTQGTKADYMFINEAPNLPEDIARTLMPGIRYQCFYNYNPTKKFWGQDFVNGNNLLVTTWADNDYLTDAQREEFEMIKDRALRPTARKIDTYQYKVYYLGEFTDLAGNVFGGVAKCSPADYFQVPAKEAIGMDFGFATDGDPTTVVGVKVWNRSLYIHEYIYEVGLTSNYELCERLNAAGINGHTPIFADYGGMGRSRMDDLIRNHGMSLYNAKKGEIMDGISLMLTHEKIVITDTSRATIDEFEGYELDENGKTHGADHAIDAARYALNAAIRY